MPKRFKRVEAGRHRAEVDGDVYELTQEHSRFHGRRMWNLKRIASETRTGPSHVEIAIKSLAEGEQALDFVLRVETYLKTIGAVAKGARYCYDWKLETKVGTLEISPNGRSVMCCFEEPKRAAEVLGDRHLNNYSGKWNFHFGHGVEPSTMFDYFSRAMRPLLIDAAQVS